MMELRVENGTGKKAKVEKVVKCVSVPSGSFIVGAGYTEPSPTLEVQQTHVNQHLNNAWLKRTCQIQTGALEIMALLRQASLVTMATLINGKGERGRAREFTEMYILAGSEHRHTPDVLCL